MTALSNDARECKNDHLQRKITGELLSNLPLKLNIASSTRRAWQCGRLALTTKLIHKEISLPRYCNLIDLNWQPMRNISKAWWINISKYLCKLNMISSNLFFYYANKWIFSVISTDFTDVYSTDKVFWFLQLRVILIYDPTVLITKSKLWMTLVKLFVKKIRKKTIVSRILHLLVHDCWLPAIRSFCTCKYFSWFDVCIVKGTASRWPVETQFRYCGNFFW